MDTIEKPWQHPIDYLTLVFWVVLFAIVAFAMADTLRVLAQWVKSTAEEAVS
jgi:hypothetical protein